MSYLIKIQQTPAIVDSVINNSKRNGIAYHSFLPNLRPRYWIYQNNEKELSTSVSALPLKKKLSKKKENVLHNEKATDFQKLSKIIKANIFKNKRKSQTFTSGEIENFMLFENDFSLDSTTTYDSNFLDSNLEIEKFFKKYSKDKNLQRHDSVSSSKKDVSQEILRNKLMYKIEDGVENNVKNIELKHDLNKREFHKLKENPTDKDEIMKLEKEKALNPIKTVDVYESINFDKFCSNPNLYYGLVELLHSSIDICMTNDSALTGLELLKHYRKKFIWRLIVEKEKRNVQDLYNTLLHGLSERDHWDIMQNVINWMELDNVKLNSESFAALFYCLSRIKEHGKENFVQREINKVLNQLFVNNISLNDIFSKTILTKEQMEKILALIQEVVPSFDIQPVTINLSSDCPLVKNLLLVNNNLESPIENIGLETLRNMVEEQIMLENKFFIQIKSVNKGHQGESTEKIKKTLLDFKKDWRNTLEKEFQKTLQLSGSNPQKHNLYLYLTSVPQDLMINIMMEMALKLMEYSGGYSPSFLQCSFMISNRIAHSYQMKKAMLNKNTERTKNLFQHYLSWYINPCGPARNSRHKWQMLIQDSERTSELDSKIVKWPECIKVSLGRFLLEFIIKHLKFPVEKNGETMYYPVLCSVLRYRKGLWREEIKCHPTISNMFQKLGFEILDFRADQMPMICPPKPWKSVNHGGYLLLNSDFIRKSPYMVGKTLRLRDVPVQHMYPVFDALNALQTVPWMINEDVLDVALKVFQNGGSKKLKVPHFPEPIQNENKCTKYSSFKDRMEERLRKRELLKKKCDEYGLWCEALYKLSLANHFRKRLFWLPQNCDFRGRVYPIPPLLNHLGADLYRSLLIFAKGKPLGPDGLDWLKIHLINLTGAHKPKTVSERLAYANQILPLIIDSAENPLEGSKWWTESDEPWQTLATCMEIKKVLSSPNPETYVCKFPIHQDGSCNGLQHYAGLGKDLTGAESVNLASLDFPQDVYSVVAKLIEEERIKDAEKGIEVAEKLEGFIERKVVKQTVMTTVYGVTHYGAKAQMSKKLEENNNFPEEYLKPASAYLTDKTFLCLKKMFSSAKDIQQWLMKCANAISSMDDYVQWVSPLGLPVLQSYGKGRLVNNFNKHAILPDKMKQRNAFPPNFIHSLDSTHMMLTALFCEQAGITFAAVHDCFWTHPCTVGSMNKICREQFISLHSQPILENLSQFFIRQYLQNNLSNNQELAEVFEAIPAKGSFDLKEVLSSVYFFS